MNPRARPDSDDRWPLNSNAAYRYPGRTTVTRAFDIPTGIRWPVQQPSGNAPANRPHLRPPAQPDERVVAPEHLSVPGSRFRAGLRLSGELAMTFVLVVMLFVAYEVFGHAAAVQAR
ncbi:hypothetical protein [Actinoplanes awajinensis]|uniref:hypothetical protein n=1 Tax=Actinoplanes awajinensis TaxID=135946 RepID=UPI0008339773|nr:hypothetical protein [Actinoplanes awajinensis]